jgi:hypothetical protein
VYLQLSNNDFAAENDCKAVAKILRKKLPDCDVNLDPQTWKKYC